ncbi:hypothetical protein pipiens_015643 [Culex pipiens pipiens]|uniref:Uncharacterized protein n=1 Tax=Culex pipiens pipiens TaxID=38569 RepID=A0ABD1CPI3_CULPP
MFRNNLSNLMNAPRASGGHDCRRLRTLVPVADLKLTEDTKPFRHCMLLPKDRKIGPAELRLFSKVRVTVQLVKEAVTVTSVPPPLAQMQSKESLLESAPVRDTVWMFRNNLSNLRNA